MSVEVHSSTQRIIVKPRTLDAAPGIVRPQTVDARPNAHISIIQAGPVGPPSMVPGPIGPQGPQGPPGSSGSAAGSFTHVQGLPSDTWVIVHSLGFYPAVTVIDSGGTMVEGDVHYDSPNQVTLSFNGAFSGTASLS